MAATFRAEQRGVAAGMAAALAVSIITAAWAVSVDAAAPPAFVADRLQFALRADVLVALCLAAAIGNVARLRFFSAQDIGGAVGAGGSEAVGRADAILQNTLEQAVLAILAHLVLAAAVGRVDVTIRVLAGLFVIGRALFALGYRHGAAARSFGFALTFYPSVLVLLGSGAVLLLR